MYTWLSTHTVHHKLNLVFHYIFLNFVEFMKRYPNMRPPCCEALTKKQYAGTYVFTGTCYTNAEDA